MSDPTDETNNAETETSVGPTSLFEVEELAPDGAPLPPAPGPDEPEPEPEPEPVAPRAKAPKPAPVAVPEIEDDEEPEPQLVWYVLKVQSSREDTIRDALERRVKIQGLQRYFGRIVVPTE